MKQLKWAHLPTLNDSVRMIFFLVTFAPVTVRHRDRHADKSCALARMSMVRKYNMTFIVFSRTTGLVSIKPWTIFGNIWSLTVFICKCSANKPICKSKNISCKNLYFLNKSIDSYWWTEFFLTFNYNTVFFLLWSSKVCFSPTETESCQSKCLEHVSAN